MRKFVDTVVTTCATLALLVGFLAATAYLRGPDKAKECNNKGGILIQSNPGWVCMSKEALIK